MRAKQYSLVMIIILLLLTIPSSSAEEEKINNLAVVLDYDLSCLETEYCVAKEPTHLVEFFGADWCEPCRETEKILDKTVIYDSDLLVLHHHPSIDDAFFLNSSLDFAECLY